MIDQPNLSEILESKKYVLRKMLAEGGMGAVYLAEQFGVEGFSKTVAIKTILESYATNPEFVRLFIGEAKLVADLVHENIVQVYQLGKTTDLLYMVMEFVDGINLEQFMEYHWKNKLPIDPEWGTFIISRVCRGLEYAHTKKDITGKPLGVVHRDISPKNIMINFEGVVKVTDFGIAKATRVMEQEEGEVLMGKVEYMSPEQANYEETDARSDIFSLGIVYYELLTRQMLFDTEDVYETLDNVKFKPIPDPRDFRADLPSRVVEIMMKMLERRVVDRYQTAKELGVEMEQYMYGKGYGPTNQKLGEYMKKHFSNKMIST